MLQEVKQSDLVWGGALEHHSFLIFDLYELWIADVSCCQTFEELINFLPLLWNILMRDSPWH